VIGFLVVSPVGKAPWRVQGDVVTTLKCVECGRIALKLNARKKCEECAKKDESMKSCFTELLFINEGCARLVPAS
jgi:hypothetical protein